MNYLVPEETVKMIEELSPKSAAMIRAHETDETRTAMAGERKLLEDIYKNQFSIDGLQETLDELVHDAGSHPASEINNDGFESQVPYLLDSGF